jgi:DNA-binding transcriptional MocR family regulator
MTPWTPDLGRHKGPRYRAIADALADDVRAGRLKAGTRLPTHRDLAGTLRVTVGTVSRAYAEAERRGLIRGEVGRGTFVHPGGRGEGGFGMKTQAESSLIDLSLNFPVSESEDRAVAKGLSALARDKDLGRLLEYLPHAGTPRQRAAGAAWIRLAGLHVEAGQVIVCNGGQHGLAIALAALAAPGDVVLAESLTYPVFKTLAGLLHLKVQGIPVDGQGLRPEAFEAACKGGAARFLYTIPTIQNPTASILPEARRRKIAAIAEAHDVIILEDDIYGLLPAERSLPLARHAPEHTVYVTSLSKTVAPGLRIGFLTAPARLVDRMIAALGATTWMAAPLLAELAASLIEDGTAAAILKGKRKEAEARQALAARILGLPGGGAQPHSFHLWLPLPDPWSGEDFAAKARQRGVAVNPGGVFVAGTGKPPAAVRVCLGAARTRDRLETGLVILRDILGGAGQRDLEIV